MTRLGLAMRVFFKIMRNINFAVQADQLLAGELVERKALPTPPAAPAAPAKPLRSEALTLLSVLQREGRLVDFLKEDLAAYSDAQIGAAVRDVHRDTAAALERMFALRPTRSEAEGTSIEVPAGFDAGRVRLTGNVAGQPPYRGVLRHTGWEASKVELPEWTGGASAANVVAPAEVEV